jgi:hypothetical protein
VKRPRELTPQEVLATEARRKASLASIAAKEASLRAKFTDAKELKKYLKRIEDWRLWLTFPVGSEGKGVCWWRMDDSFLDTYVDDEKCVCAYGCGSLLRTQEGNFQKHAENPTHQKAVKRASPPQLITSAFAAAASTSPAAVASTVLDRAAYLLGGMRFTALRNVGEFLKPSMQLLGGRIAKNDGGASPLSSGGTIDRAKDKAAEMYETEVKTVLKDQSGALLIDEAGSDRTLGIVFCSEGVGGGKPVLLKLIVDFNAFVEDKEDASKIKPADKCARGIIEALASVGKSIKDCVCLVGDNGALNDAIAKILKLPRLRCIPHCLALVYAVLSKPFKYFTAVTCSLAALLSAGGGTHRRDAVTAGGLLVSRMHPKGTRWGQVLAMGDYLLEKENDSAPINFLRMKAILESHTAFAMKATSGGTASAAAAGAAETAGGAAAAGEAGDDRLVVCSTPTDVRYKQPASKVLSEVRNAYGVCARPAEIELLIVKELCGELQMVLTMACANSNEMVPDIDQRLARLRVKLAHGCTDGMQSIIVDKALRAASFKLPPATVDQVMAHYCPIVKQACAEALIQWDKFIPEALTSLEHRLRFEPQRKPVSMPAPQSSGYYKPEDIAAFFGASDAVGDVTLDCIADWVEYVRHWDSIPPAVKALGIRAFWNHPSVLGLLPNKGKDLQRFALWYANYPTSNVATERVFAVMRTVDQAIFNNMSDETHELVVQSRVNSWIVDRIVDRVAVGAGEPVATGGAGEGK